MSTTTLAPQPTRTPQLRIARYTLDMLDRLVLAAGQNEACGFIVGMRLSGRDGATAYRLVPMPNIAADPTVAYEMDPMHLLAFEDGLLTTGEDVCAVYHSHPNRRAAVASAADIAQARPETPFQLIVSHHDGEISGRTLYLGDFSGPGRTTVLGEDPDELAEQVRP